MVLVRAAMHETVTEPTDSRAGLWTTAAPDCGQRPARLWTTAPPACGKRSRPTAGDGHASRRATAALHGPVAVSATGPNCRNHAFLSPYEGSFHPYGLNVRKGEEGAEVRVKEPFRTEIEDEHDRRDQSQNLEN